MARFKSYDYAQKVFVPVFLEEQLVPGTLEFAVHTLIENRIDMSIFDDRYSNDKMGSCAYDPKILLKVVLLAYSRGMESSRPIERACVENITFMAMACNARPDHSTIAAFVSTMKDQISRLFTEVLLVCEEEGLLGGTFFALDGCKLPSNASKQWSGKIDEIKRKKEKIGERVDRLLKSQIEADKKDPGGQAALSDRSKRDSKIEQLQKKAERIEQWLEENDRKIGRKGTEVKSNVTDNESTTMLTSHGTIQGYNAQALVDDSNQVIVHAEAFGEGPDHYHIPPMIDGAKENMKSLGHSEDYFEDATLTADALYHSNVNMEKCEEEKLDAYIPDRFFRDRDPAFKGKRKRGKRKAKRFHLEDFDYCEADDVYKCPKGRLLRLFAKDVKRDRVIYRIYKAGEDACIGCKLKKRCISNKKGKRRTLTVPTGYVGKHYSKEMADKIDTDEGRRIYNRRFAVVEPVFGNIRSQKRMDRFTLRGKIKVNIQWMLYCMVHNMEKIAHCGAL
ncbi:MAG: IS1182 family transposase [Candidatus Thorarchaeota archaeon]|jgi:transposase/IS5 family transposase